MTFHQARERLGVMLATASSEADKEALRVARRRLLKAMEDTVVPEYKTSKEGVAHFYCPVCFRNLEGEENYCWYCGAELDWEK